MAEEDVGFVEVIARGVCVMGNQVLLCVAKQAGITYLPGGHVELGETAREALVREIQEEMGRASEAGKFLGVCEHRFIQKSRLTGEPIEHTEINLVFELKVVGLSPASALAAQEAWIGFRWCPLAELAEARFEPSALIPHLAEWLRHPGGHLESDSRARR